MCVIDASCIQPSFGITSPKSYFHSDPVTFELIQKVQTLQKRLIHKTEEVVEKELLIQEKEKQYIELKVGRISLVEWSSRRTTVLVSHLTLSGCHAGYSGPAAWS